VHHKLVILVKLLNYSYHSKTNGIEIVSLFKWTIERVKGEMQ